MNQSERIIRKSEVLTKTGVSHPTIWRWERDGKFPKRLQLGGSVVGWLESEVNGWIAERAADR